MQNTAFLNPYDIRIIGGRRKVIWKDGDNGLQRVYRPPIIKTVLPLKSNIVISDCQPHTASLIRYPIDPTLVVDPQRVPAHRLSFSSSDSNSSQNGVHFAESATRFGPGAHAEVTGPPSAPPLPPVRGARQRRSLDSDCWEVEEAAAGLELAETAAAGMTSTHQQQRPSQTTARHSEHGSEHVLSAGLPILPPIRSQGSADTNDGGSGRRRRLGELEEITLKNAVLRSGGIIEEHHVQKLLNELRMLDRDRDGTLDAAQMRRALSKHQISFSPSIEDSLLVKFQTNSGVVEYERLVQYLMAAKLQHCRAIELKQQLTGGGARTSMPPPRRGPTFTERDQHTLTADLTAYMRLHDPDPELLLRTVYSMDRDRTGRLSRQQIQTALSRVGLSDMPVDLFGRLCTAADRHSTGLCNVEMLLRYLERARPTQDRLTIPGIGENHRPRAPKVPSPLAAPVHTGRQGMGGVDGGGSGTHPFNMAYSMPSASSSLREQSPMDRTSRTKDLNKLHSALRDLDTDGCEYVSSEDVGRVTESYNIIYSLGIPSSVVSSAISQATDQRYGLVQVSTYMDTLHRHKLG